jgi:hypothetical protein
VDDNIILLISVIATIALGGVFWRFRSLLRNIAELLLAVEKCLDGDCTTDEVKAIIKELQETVADGLGVWAWILSKLGKR